MPEIKSVVGEGDGNIDLAGKPPELLAINMRWFVNGHLSSIGAKGYPTSPDFDPTSVP